MTVPTPTVITTFPVGNPAGQQPLVVVRDMTNGYDLYLLNEDTVSDYPASCVKLMTLLLAWQHHSTDWTSGTVTVTTDDVTQPAGLSLTSAGLMAGDVVTWEDLACCLILPSGFDAAQAIARVIGDAIYAAAGNTGTQGIARFVEAMNAKAGDLGMTNTTFTDPFGGSKTDVTRNQMSARDLSTVSIAAFSIDELTDIAGATSHGVTVTGVNARTMVLNNVVAFLNGPSVNPAHIADADVLAAKSGIWVYNSDVNYNMTVLWLSPNGTEVVITTIGSLSTFSSMLDQRGLMYMLVRDFPYLSDVEEVEDTYWTDVNLLVAGSLSDESDVGRTVTVTDAVAGDPLVLGSSGGIALSASTDDVHVTDGPDISVTSGNMTVEMWYAGPGSAPATGVEYLFASKLASGQREWAANYYSGGFNIFASSDGSNWTNAVAYTVAAVDQAVFFNGAPRHIALVKDGSILSLYINGEEMPTTISCGTIYDGTADLSVCRPGSVPVGIIDDYRVTMGVARYSAAMETLVAVKFPRS